MDEFTHDRAGSDKGNLDGEIVEISWLHDGQGGHLCAGLDLEGAYRVGTAEEVVGGGIIVGNVSEIDFLAALVADAEAVFHRSKHAQAEKIDFYDAEILAVVLVPLHDGAVGHGGRLERDNGIEAVVTDDHASGVLTQVPGEGEGRVVEVEKRFETGVVDRYASLLEGAFEVGDLSLRIVVLH